MTRTILQLAAPTPDILQQYQQIAQGHGYPPLLGSPEGSYILVTDQDDRLIAAATVIRTHGAYVVFEDFVLNPEVPLRVRHRAVELGVEQITCLCNALNRIAYCPVQDVGTAKILARYGFHALQSIVCRRNPSGFALDEMGAVAPDQKAAPNPPQAPDIPEVEGDQQEVAPEPPADESAPGEYEPPQPSAVKRRAPRRPKRRVEE